MLYRHKSVQTLFRKIFLSLYLFLIFFPYIQIVKIEGVGDTQPWALLISIIVSIYYGFIRREPVPYQLKPLIILLFIAICIFIFSGVTTHSIRSLVGYFSLPFIGYSSYMMLKDNGGLSHNIIKSVILIWGIVGLIQLYIPDFLTGLLSDMRTTETRGVISLAPEPSHYGTVCIFLLFYAVFHIKSYFYSLFILIQIFIFAKSSIIMLFLGLAWIVYVIVYKKLLTGGVLTMILFCMVFFLSNTYMQGTRMTGLMNLLKEDPLYVVRTDASINDRVAAVYFPLKGFIGNWGLPMGINMNSFSEYLNLEINRSDRAFFWVVAGAGRMHSGGLGGILLEMGLFALFIPFFFIKNIRNYFYTNRRMGITIAISFMMFMITPIPMALPYMGFFAGYLLYYNYTSNLTRVQ
jgi:hypothetical protein